MKKLLVLFFVVAMCIPSYGGVGSTILVYRHTSAFDPWIDYTDTDQDTATNVGTKQLTGYLVLDIDDAGEFNDDPTVIFYGVTGSDKWGTHFNVSAGGTIDGYYYLNSFDIVGKAYSGVLMSFEWGIAQERTGALWNDLYGKTGLVDIGRGAGANREDVPSSLKGITEATQYDADDIAPNALGNITATLDSTNTQYANKTGHTHSQLDTVNKILADLGNQGYIFPGAIQALIDAAHSGDVIIVPAGTYHESLHINTSNITLKSAKGKASTIIDPGASYQQAIEIGDEHVTIDGFTIKQGTQVFDGDHPQEHTIWVHANYSTIKNCTIIGAGGNQACICIADRDDTPGGTYLRRYNAVTDTTKGHTIQNNTFRYGTATAGSGQGWGIWAYNLTDGCLIKGNTFNGDAADLAAWNTNEGAPGTCILIHNATNGGSPYAVTIQDNTAQYVAYSFLTFYAAFPYNDSLVPGKLYEQPEASTVEDVLVTNNTVHYLGTNASHAGGAAVSFQGERKYDSYAPGTADLTIDAGKVTITANTFYSNDYGVNIKGPKYSDPTHDPAGDGSYGCVLGADKITIGTNNSIYGNTTCGVYNGTYVDIAGHQDGGAKLVNAEYNWWGDWTGPYNLATNPHGHGNQVSDSVDYAPYWQRIHMIDPSH